jgi:hypothetical protein
VGRKTIALATLACGLLAAAAWADVDVNVNVNVGLPVLKVGPDPIMAVVPGTYVYFVADLDGDLFFYQGYWWRAHNGRWHRSAAAGGPWVFFKAVPHPLLNLPPGWRKLPPGHARFKYAELKKNWKQWEKEKRWDKKDGPNNKPQDQGKVKDAGKAGRKPGAKTKGGKGR